MDSEDFATLRSYMADRIAALSRDSSDPTLLKTAIAALAADIEHVIATLEVCQQTIDMLAEDFIDS